MTNYTKAELRNSALEAILVKDIHESVSAADAALVDDEAQRLIEYLEDEALITFDASSTTTTENIQGRVFNAIRDMLAEIIAPKYGVMPRQVVGPRGPESMYENALRRLRRSVADDPDDVPARAIYF
jgi:hypothetical protein